MSSAPEGCFGGLHEVCVGVPDLETAIADFAAYGCYPLAQGTLTAAESLSRYGVNSVLRSARLGHQQSDHGLVRLMQWEKPLNTGLGLGPNLRAVGSRWGVRVTRSVFNIVNHAERAREAGLPISVIPPLLAVIGEVSGQRTAQPFRDPIVGVREMVLLQPYYRQVFFERFGYDSPAYGQIDAASLLATSQHTHVGLMIADDDAHTLDFYDEILGLKRTLDEHTPYDNATGSRLIFGLEPGEGFHMVDFDDPRTGPALQERRSGKLKCVRFASAARIDRLLEHSRLGCLGYSGYCWRAHDIERMHRRLESAGVRALTDVLVDEFGRPSLSFFAPDGYHWILLQHSP
ncbi:MAG: VOC family protein [Sinobacteraceae bacterium]|nr:VOC family protein [Nevskiaceae bacterium]